MDATADFGCSRCRHAKTGCLSCNPEKILRWLAKKEAAEAAEAAKAAEEATEKASSTESKAGTENQWDEVKEAEACFEDLQEEMVEPDLAEPESGEEHGLDAEAKELLEAAFAEWKPSVGFS